MDKKCTNCGNTGLKASTPKLYHYKMSGLENVYLKGGVTEYICPKCGARSTAIKNVIGLHKAIAQTLAITKRRLAGNELRFLREQLGFSAEELAKMTEYNQEYVRKIESGSEVPKAPFELFLRLAVLRGLKAPEYDLRDFAIRREYEIEELQFENKNRDWKASAA
ncbi:MAG TPA: helix-turn-helix domain-containing protein [Bdellovibrionota bacterium]|nr:helix-turn-helix domain-containing protein [Bdellovibrionota bacterium]